MYCSLTGPAKPGFFTIENKVSNEKFGYQPSTKRNFPVTVIKKGKEHVPLNIISFNARSLCNKYAHLHSLIAEEDPDVVAVTETFLDISIDEAEFTPPGYKAFRKDRNISWYKAGTYTDTNRGGVLLLIKEELNPVLHIASDVSAEILWVSTSLNPSTDWLFGVCYRPEVDEDLMLPRIIDSINKIDNQNVMLLGDFNFRNISWELGTCIRPLEQFFLDSINDNLLHQIIDIPTRGDNILDLAFVGDPTAVEDYDVIPGLGSSDHNIVKIQIKCLIPRIARAKRKIYLYSKGDYEEMDKNLLTYDWDASFNHKDLNENWEKFKEIYQSNIESYVPSKMVNPGQRLLFPWVKYKSVIKAKRKCRDTHIQAKISGLNADKYLAEDSKKVVDSAVLSAKAHYENKLTEQIKEDPKRFFNYTRHFTKSSSSVDVLECDGKKIIEDNAKADILNTFFVSVTKEEPPIEAYHFNSNSTNPPFILRDIDFSIQDVRVKLSKLKANKASGPDGVSVNVLRNCLNFDRPLHFLFTKSIQTSITPQDWRDANVTPLFKKGSRTKPTNYRPVSLTSQIVKILERLVYDKILETLLQNKTISCHQHGFQSSCSCVTQLLDCMHDWTINFDQGLQTDIIYLDFAKAFDTVPHQRLLIKLKNCGIRGKALNWIRTFLSERRQRVILRNGVSSWKNVLSGVPQGSILGPLLFLIYVNDMPDGVKTTAKMFADDTKVYNDIKIVNDCELLQEDLNSLSHWSKKWLLCFNETKCVVLKIKMSILYMYTLNGHVLEQVSSQKDLGITIHESLKPSEHIGNIVKRANQRAGLIRRCFTDLTKEKVTILYISLIRPILEYASTVWNPQLKKDIDLLEYTQRRCLRLSKEAVTLPDLEDRRLFNDLCEVYKYTHDLYKNGLTDMFCFSENLHLRGHSLRLRKSFSRTSTRKSFFSERVINEWNSLPEKIVSAPTPACFKERLKTYRLKSRDPHPTGEGDKSTK